MHCCTLGSLLFCDLREYFRPFRLFCAHILRDEVFLDVFLAYNSRKSKNSFIKLNPQDIKQLINCTTARPFLRSPYEKLRR